MRSARILLMLCLAVCMAQAGAATRIKDLGHLDGWRDNQLFGYGLVTGLAGTGDSPRNKAARQALANLLGQFDVTVLSDQVQSRNVAMVMVTASLPAFARAGDKLDVTITSAGDARSLVGGVLMMTPLKGPDNRVHALAQGAVSVGGYKYDMNGNIVQKNHPTTGIVPDGANVELGETTEVMAENGHLLFRLDQPDYTTASRIAEAINGGLGGKIASARDAASIDLAFSDTDRSRLVALMTRIENLTVEPDIRARVVVNERTGTVVSGGDVRISKVVITQGDLKVSVATDNLYVQPPAIVMPGAVAPGERLANSRVDVEESQAVMLESGNTVADLVRALNRIHTSTRDVIAILQGIKAAGALHADLIIQ